MKNGTAIVVLLSCISIAHANPVMFKIGEPFTQTRVRLYVDGWRADPLVHSGNDEYMGSERKFAQKGYFEVDYCSVGKSFCVLQYTKNNACLRLYTQGEEIDSMKVGHWSNDCREQETGIEKNFLPADVRYAAQLRKECDEFGQCEEIDAFLLELKKKYAQHSAIMKLLNSLENPR